MISQGGMRHILEIASPSAPSRNAKVGSVQSQFAEPPDDFDVFTQSLVCVDYGVGGDELWKQRTLEDIRGTGYLIGSVIEIVESLFEYVHISLRERERAWFVPSVL
jgi:hypothetical protein